MIQVQLKLKLKPSQERTLRRWLWHLTAAWNWSVKKIEADARAGIYHSGYGMKALVRGHSVRIGVPADALEGIVSEARVAWQRCYDGLSGRPNFKGRRNRLNSIPLPHGSGFRPTDGSVNIPTFGRVRYHQQDIPEGRIVCGRVIRRASGWYACLSIKAEPKAIPAIADGEIGIDPGFSRLLTCSNGEVIDRPTEIESGAQRLAQAQRGQRKRLTARLRERITNRRKDRNHKLSRRLVSENALIAWSKDGTSALQRQFGKSVLNAGHHQLRRMLAYKCRTGGRKYIEVASRHSTRTCSSCQSRTGPTGWAGLSVRAWTCSACGASHDRDVNAAIVTLQRAGTGAVLSSAAVRPCLESPLTQHGEAHNSRMIPRW